jgi:hypothetical protein
MNNLNMLSKLDEAIRINTEIQEKPNGNIFINYLYDSSVINEIEYHLFYIQNMADRNIFLDRLLYRVFYNKMYLIEVDYHSSLMSIKSELESRHKNIMTRKILNEDEKEKFLNRIFLEDWNYIIFTISLIRDLKSIIQSFGLSFDEKKYPLHKFTGVNLPKEETRMTRIPLNKLTEQQAINLHTSLCNRKLITPDIDSFLYWLGVTEKKTDKIKHIQWTGKSKSLLAYFVDKVTDNYNLRHGKKRLVKPFEIMFNESGISNLINEYKNKTGQNPIGYEEIDDLFN